MNKLLATIAEIIEIIFFIALIIIFLPIWLPILLVSDYNSNKWLEKQKHKSE
jgi:cellobiose-specific phosphotransferase system component IIC